MANLWSSNRPSYESNNTFGPVIVPCAVSSGDVELGTGQYAADNGILDLTMTTDFSIPSGDSDYLVTYDY